jgi:multiple sugar transport system ATP-binding protein
MAEIALRGVTKRFDDGTVAVDHLDLTVGDGELVILVGPSGCGKSTALRMVAGLEEVTEGEIVLDGEPVTNVAASDRDIAMVFQNYALYPHMTVAKNMSYALRLRGMSKSERDEKVRETARALELEELLDRRPAQLSGGQRQRVAMGRAIVREPKAFLMDEPLSNLDAKLRVQMRAELARLKSRLGATMLYVTHDQTEAMTLGDRVVAMRGGVLQQAGTPTELFQHPANLFVAGFIGSPAMNFVPAHFEGDTLVLPFARLELERERRARIAVREGEPVVAGLRPHAFGDAALVDERIAQRGVCFDATVDVLESLGTESFAYCRVPSGGAEGARVEELTGTPAGQIAARLDPISAIAAGDRGRLWLDASAVHLFAAEDAGRNLEAA